MQAPQPPRQRARLERPGASLCYEVTGSGPPIVFLHGLGGNHISWWQQVAHFAAGHTCVTLAARGFWPSACAGEVEPLAFAGDLAALIDALALVRPTVVAQSMGGWGAVEYALAHPGALRALVLAATTGTLDPTAIDEPERSRLGQWQAAGAAAAADLMRSGVHVAAGARMAAEQPALHLLYRHIDDMSAGLDKDRLRQRLGAARTRPPADLARAGCPVLFVSGDEDIVIPPFAADAIARKVPAAVAAHIPGAGHSAYFERPAAFNRIVADFLARHP